jgi:hypothetical protein
LSAYLIAVILSYSGLGATTYGWGEMYCGPPDTPQECSPGSPTASGALLDPFARPQVAIALKAKTRLRSGLTIQARLPGGKCTTLELVDKKAPRFFQSDSPWDLTPAALFALGAVSPNPTWSGRLEICSAPSF